MSVAELVVTEQAVRLEPDPARVVTQLFVAGQEVVGGSESRASSVVTRILELDEDVVERELARVLDEFAHRHRDLPATFSHHADRIAYRLDPEQELSDARWLLLGATFTHEYAVEAAALCNPSIVAHPDQGAAAPGTLRVVLSVRGIGEGHRSSIGFRTGTLDGSGTLTLDPAGPHPVLAAPGIARFDRGRFETLLRASGDAGESTSYVLDNLGDSFTIEELDAQLQVLTDQRDTRRNAPRAVALLRAIAARTYSVGFPPASELSERVLAPATAAESHGVEDARFVRFVDDLGAVDHYATYTAFDGTAISQQLLHTRDFVDFDSTPIAGPAAAGKGLAIFPRTIGGRYAALSRHDRESNAIAFSDSLVSWDRPATFQVPRRPWELVQLGNCGSPIETDEGWLVLTHGVGPMRTYSIGAVLLDLEDPTRVARTLDQPLLSPPAGHSDGYVPSVVYTCGAILHAGTVVIPHGVNDSWIQVASVPWAALHDAMTPTDPGTLP